LREAVAVAKVGQWCEYKAERNVIVDFMESL